MENQPEIPSIRARSAGATTVFIIVCPVLKSFPAMGTAWIRANFFAAGKSTVRLGAPLAKGTPSLIQAHA